MTDGSASNVAAWARGLDDSALEAQHRVNPVAQKLEPEPGDGDEGNGAAAAARQLHATTQQQQQDAGVQLFLPGQRVEARGLVRAAEHNGRRGVVRCVLAERGRCAVVFEGRPSAQQPPKELNV